MNHKNTSKAGERMQSFPVTIMAQSYGNWTLGYAWVDVSIVGGSVTGLALYARLGVKEPSRRVVGSVKEAIGFLHGCRVPARRSGKFMAHVMAEDTARFLGAQPFTEEDRRNAEDDRAENNGYGK